MSPDPERGEGAGRKRRNPGARGSGASRRSDPGTSGPSGRADKDGTQVEGFHAVHELLVAGRRRVREVWLADEGPHVAELEGLAVKSGTRVRLVPAERLAMRARSEVPQGVIAFAAPVPTVRPDDLLAADAPFVLVLDGITDPGNLGAILRTAETAGVTGVVIPTSRSTGLGPTALKAAAGAVEYLAVARVAGVPGFLEQARRAGVWTVGLDASGDTDIDDLPVADAPVALVVGAEGRGLGRLTRDRCDLVASIPLRGRLESLNASAAAAIALHAVARRRGEAPSRR